MGKTLGYGEITVANMTEPFTVMLTNEAQQFATDSNRKVTSAQSYYTDIIVIRGSQERTDYTIGNITSGSGITVSKNSKRVTFSVSAGTTIGADAGVIEIPITLDGQTVKKQFSWSCGKQGPQGVKGDPGTSVKITSKSVTYQTSTSGTTAPTGTWSTTVPTVNNGQYLWTKTTVQYSDGNKTEAYSVSYKGTNGTNGTSVTVSKTEVTYQVSASGTTAPTGTWSTTMPSCDQGQYLWTKTYVKYSDGKDTTSYSVSYKGVDGEKFAFNMLRETNQGSKHWVNLGASGKYSVESITTDDNINAAKLICTEAIASNEWQFCDFSDYEMLKSLKASTTYTLSYDIKANRSGKILHNIKTGGGQKVFFANDIACKVLGNETWEHVSLKMTSGTTLPNLDGQVIYMFGDALSKVGYSIIKNLKLTEGIVDTPWAPHPEDLEGRGVSETVQYYLATSQASGVTSSTSGWSTDITTQKLTADKKYLWNCYQTKYSDGTSEPISTPKVIGVYGDKGTSTKIIRTSYEYTQTNIDKFSTSGYSGVWGVNDATTGLKVGDSVLLKVKNTTKCSDCLIFANITAIPSNYSLTCTSYGVIDNGSDGQDGAGFHWNLLKYSGDLSKQVLGGAGTYTATVESIEDKTTPSGQAEKITYTVQGTGGKFIQTGKYIKEGDIKQGKTYTVSVWCKCSSIKSTGVINAEFLDNKTYVNPTLSTEWQQYVVTGVANKDVTSTSSASAISFYYSDNMSVGDIFYISSPKVEEGDKASPWCTTYEETLAKNLTITPSSQYFKSTDGGKTFAPNTITIKPTIQGEISFGKWQYSIDGGVSFADVVSGQKGLTVSNNVLTVSKDSSLYSDAVTMITFRAVADDSSFYDTCNIAKIYDVSDIGDGRNLLWNSNFAKTDEAITGTTNSWGLHTRGTNLVASIDTSTKHNGFNTLKTVSAANGDKNSSNDLEWFAWGISERTSDNLHSKNQNYTLSFYAKASVTTDFIVRWGYDAYGADTTRTLTTNWQKYEIKLHQATSAYSITIIFKLLTAGTVWFSEFKLEKGSSATGYSTAPEDLQTAILSTKNSIDSVSSKVDTNTKSIQDKVSKTTYERELTLVKGDLSKANEGLNKWRYEIYPKSLFDSADQGKSTIDIFAKNLNLVPSQTVLLDDASLSTGMGYGDNHIAYALTFVKMSAKKDVTTKMFNDDGASLYVNGGLIITRPSEYTNGEEITFTLAQGWNCIEVVVNEGGGDEGFRFSTTLSKLSECQMMNCYYGTPVARQSRITNQLVDVTKNLNGVTSTVQDVMTAVGNSGNITEFKNNYSKWKQSVDKIETRVGEKYVTNEKFNGLEIGGRNLLTKDDCNMSKWQNLYPAHCKITSNDYLNHVDYVPTGNEWEIVYTKISVTKGQKYILSFDYKINKAYNYLSGQKYGVYLSTSVPTNAAPANIITNGQYVIENTVTNIKRGMITFTAAVDTLYIVINGGCIDDNQTGLSFEFNKWKLEKGNKATDWTPAPEDNEINGQNLVSNLPDNWEQGGFDDGKTNIGCDYATNKTSMTTRIRCAELIPVSGQVTISNAYANSQKPIQYWITAFDVNKKWLGKDYVSTAWTNFPATVDMKDAKYLAIILRYNDESAITPSDISKICLKIERGTSATPFTLAPEDVNGKIVNVETIANQTAKKFEWIVKGGDKSSSMVLTDDFLNIVANNINLTGKVTFNSFDSAAQKKINDIDTKAGNASTAASTAQASANNAKAAADKAQSSVDRLEIGGRNLVRLGGLSGNGATSFSYDKTTDTYTIVSPVVSTVWGIGAAVKYDDNHKVLIPYGKTYILSFEVKVPQALSINIDINNYAVSGSSWAGNDNDAGSARGQSSYSIPANTWTKVWVRWANTNTKNTNKVDLYDNSSIGLVTKDCTSAVTWQIRHVKGELGNKPTDWTPAPEDVSQDATNKASQALTDAKNYSSNAVNWVTSNGSSTTSLNSMVKKWTDGAVSDTTQINGGWIKANTITASKIALADFTNYSQLTRDTAATYGFAVTDDTDGTWFSTQGIRRDQFISEIFPCNGGESYLIEYDISTNAKGANNSTDTKNYIGVAIGVYGYTGTVGSNGLPNKATNIWYATRVTGSEAAAVTHVKTTITTSTATKQFRIFLQSNGYYFEGTTKIRNLSVRRMYGGTLIVDGSITADKIATDAIKSRNYISSGGTQGSFLNLSDGSFQSPNLSWDANGNLIAKNANLSGKITATDGSIGKFKITDQWLVTGSGSTCAGLGGSDQAFWAGAANSTVAPFRVGYDGSFTSSNADISGKITATNGKIGRYDITSTYLMTNSGSNASGIGGDQAFWAGAEDSNSAPFRVGYDGVLWAENAAIRGSIETGNLGDEGDTVSIINGHIGIQGTSNNVEIYSTGFKFGIDGDYYLESVSDGVKCYRNLYATDLKASGWLYAGEVHSSGAVVIASDSESFYWAHGYQIARGTSWGGVCIGDDSQGLRLYGTSIWASHGISTSDENLKENFTTLDQYEDFYMNLNPIGFNYIGDYDGKKTHFGFGAHKTEDILESEGYDSDKFAVVTHRPLVQEDIEKRFGKDVEVDIETEYGISYTEFIALNTHMIQKTRRELTKVKQEKADLEARLQAIEAKLGL